jgi:uroporphyrinogen-III decarboxylase
METVMKRRELVKTAISHRATERPPYCMVLTREAEKRHLAQMGSAAVEFLDNDVVQVGAPWWGWHQLGDDWRGPDAPTSPSKVIGRGDYQNFFDGLKLLRAHSDKYILVTIFGSHFEKANFARGIENFLMDMVAAPDSARALLTRIIDKNMVMLENILAAPEIDGVLLGSDWGSQRGLLMSPTVWNELIRPGEQREYDLLHGYGKDVWVHSCGNIEPIIPSLIEMGVNVLNPVQPEAMDIARLKADYGSSLTFWGGVSTQDLLPNGTPEQVKGEARKVRAMMADGGGYIFGPSQDIQDDVPLANIAALLEVARERLK